MRLDYGIFAANGKTIEIDARPLPDADGPFADIRIDDGDVKIAGAGCLRLHLNHAAVAACLDEITQAIYGPEIGSTITKTRARANVKRMIGSFF